MNLILYRIKNNKVNIKITICQNALIDEFEYNVGLGDCYFFELNKLGFPTLKKTTWISFFAF